MGLGIPGAISNHFKAGDSRDKNGNDATSATNNGTFGSGGYKIGDIAYEGLSPKQDSLTQFFRSFENAQAKTGQEKTAVGQSGYAAGAAGLDKSQTDLQPAIDYFTKLLGGDQASVTSAVGPEIDQITSQFDQVRKMTSENAPRGGGRASGQSQDRFAQIQQITNLLNNARKGAATGLVGATGQESNTAANRASLGLSESSQGFQDLQSAIQAAESRKGFNVQESSANKNLGSNLLSAGSNLLSALV